MPSATMCLNKTCPARFTCYRFMKKPDADQYYNEIEPETERNCSFFMPVWKK